MTKKYNNFSYITGGKYPVVWMEGRVSFTPKPRKAGEKDVTMLDVSLSNRTSTVKSLLKKVGGNEEDVIPYVKDENEYVGIRVEGWDNLAERMIKAIHPGDIVEIFGTARLNEYNGKTNVIVTARDFKVSYRNKKNNNNDTAPVAEETGEDLNITEVIDSDSLPF